MNKYIGCVVKNFTITRPKVSNNFLYTYYIEVLPNNTYINVTTGRKIPSINHLQTVLCKMPMYTNLNNAHKAIEQAVMNKLGYKFMRYESTFSSINFRHKQIGIQYINNQDESNKPTPPLIHPDKIVNMNKVKDRILTDMLTEENKLNLVKQAEYAATYGMGAYKLQDILLNKTNQKETQMLIPITTETKHFINSADVQSMSKADLLRNLSILENNINNLRKLKTQNRSIKAEIKNQKHMLKKVAAHLNSKY